MLHVKEVKYTKDYCLWLAFDDGSAGNIDLHHHLKGPVFEPLKDKVFFSQVVVDQELETIVWPNGADFAPEFLQSLLTRNT